MRVIHSDNALSFTGKDTLEMLKQMGVAWRLGAPYRHENAFLDEQSEDYFISEGGIHAYPFAQ